MPRRLPPTTQAKVFNVAVGSIVKMERKKQYMQQQHLARKIGVRTNQMSQFESGETAFPLFKIHQVSRTLNISVDVIVSKALALIAKTKQELKK